MAKDPYYYFRIEAQELLEGLGSGLLDLERNHDPEVLRKLLRLAHTLKGAARVVKLVQIGELAHSIEGHLSPFRDSGAPVESNALEAALGDVDRIRAEFNTIIAPQPDAATDTAAPPRSAADDSLQSVRVGIRELDGMIEGISESVSTLAALEREGLELAAVADAARLAGGGDDLPDRLASASRRIQTLVESAGGELRALRSSTSQLRLVSVQVLVGELERSVRDAAQTVGRQVVFKHSGTETRIDAVVLSALRGALRHVVQNAVAHGIEPGPDRTAAGKPPGGTVQLTIERRGHRVAFLCSDDGRGLDLDLVRRVAIERGLTDAATARTMDAGQLVGLLMHGGLSTAESVSHVAGRGIGLDVVRETVAGLKGEMDIRTESGRGTTVELLVPSSLSSLPALAVEIGDEQIYVPLDSVLQTLRVKTTDISRSAEGARVRVADRFVPYSHLTQVLRRTRAAHAGNGAVREPHGTLRHSKGAQTVIVLSAAGQTVAVGVDRLAGVEDVVLRSLPAHVGAEPVLAGVALDIAGGPRLVLSAGAAARAVAESREFGQEVKPPRQSPILVIDDSLTTRMLEQSILESAGYEVDLAVCAEDALEMARKRDYGLYIVDVEMPGMNGFEYIAQTRQDPVLRRVPAVLVTSRAADEDKRRGREVGASAYIVKSEFNQQDILGLIKRLLG